MRIRAGWALLPALASLIISAIPGAAQASEVSLAATPATSTASAGAQPIRTVTLITGDKVTVTQGVGGVPSVSVQQGPKRSDVRFQISHYWNGTDHHISVVPSDAQALLAAGRLDSRSSM
ncbi:hypothetical protein [Streptomyces sp. CA-106110]|uniref:hypothetical protein n=1 Tax=Streptomyces sp. CA-106110 TaxID=3240044 RepID=UPI003D8C7998